MIDYDSYMSLAQIRDLLKHVHSLHLDYAVNGEQILGAPGCEEAWNYFQSLDCQTRFHLISIMLNELNFKTTIYTMLMLIRSSTNPVTNGTFLCLQSHLHNLFATSLGAQEIQGIKAESMKATGHIKLIRFDGNMLWSPLHSEALLQNITLSSLFATKLGASTSASSTSAPDMVLAISSNMIRDVDSLRREVAGVISGQCRFLPVRRGSYEEVDRASRTHGASSGPGAQQQMTSIATTSLAAVLALQMAHGVDSLWRRFKETSAPPLLPKEPASSFVYLHCSTEDTTNERDEAVRGRNAVFSAQFLDTMWRGLDSNQRRQLLSQVSFVANGDSATTTGGSRGARKKGSVVAAGGGAGGGGLEVKVEQLQAEFRGFLVRCTAPRRQAPYSSWEEEEARLGNMARFVSAKEDSGDEWIDLEGGQGGGRAAEDLRMDSLQRRQEEFVEWCLRQEHLGSVLCEYVCLCPLFKVFAAPTAGLVTFSWIHWAMSACVALEHLWMDAEAERLCQALGAVGSSSLDVSTVKGGSSKTRKKKKAARKNSLKRAAVGAATVTGPLVANRQLLRTPLPMTDTPATPEDVTHVHVEESPSSSLPTTPTAVRTEVTPSDKGEGTMSPGNAVLGKDTYLSESLPAEVEQTEVMATIEYPRPPALSGEKSFAADPTDESVAADPVLSAGSDLARDESKELSSAAKGSMTDGASCTEKIAMERAHDDDGFRGGNGDGSTSADGGDGDMAGVREAECMGDDGDTSEEASLCSDQLHLSGRLSARLVSSGATAMEGLDASAGEVVGIDGNGSRVVKSHKGDFLRTECDGEERPNTDSANRIDLIRWDQQRTLAETLTTDVLDMAGSLHRIANLRRPWQVAAIERVRVLVQSIWPQAQCEVFGSFGTGLAIPSSDVDIVVSGIGVAHQLHWWGGRALTAIAVLTQHLQQTDWVSTIRAIEHTAMPIIKLTTASVPMPALVGAGGVRRDFRGVIKIDLSIASPSASPQLQLQSQHLPPSYAYDRPAAFMQVPSGQQQQVGGAYAGGFGTGSPSRYSESPLHSGSEGPDSTTMSHLQLPVVAPQQIQAVSAPPPLPPLPPAAGTAPHQGVSTRDFVLRLCSLNPSLIPLVLVLKQFLQEKGLHDPFTGGLSSYALTIMVAAILQPHALERPETQPDLGTLLLTFLRRYGTRFDTRKYAVVLSINGPFVSLSPGGANAAHVPRVGTPGYWLPADPVVVSDPLNSQNNLGRSCFGFRQLQQEFDNALERVMGCMQDLPFPCDGEGRRRSVLGAVFGTVHHDSVVRLQSQVWCPLEESSGSAPARVSPIAVLNTASDKAPSGVSVSTDRKEALRRECHRLLEEMSEQQLVEAKTALCRLDKP